jgi:aminoglycoside phosphotransferase (APT) family kinase protein
MPKMHENELDIDEHLVRALLESQCPKWAHLPLKAVTSSGTDHALFRLGNEYVVRLPRIDGATKNLNKEYEWVPKISQLLKTPLSEPLFKGSPSESYPWAWMINKWNEGHNPNFEKENEHAQLAKDLAHFLNELHSIRLDNGPYSRRGLPLKKVDTEVKSSISKLKGEIDVPQITFLWHQAMNVPLWNKDPVWVHGDFLPGNILIQNNRLSAVIDFSDLGIGDPACDLIIAWCILKPNSRKIFRENLENIDDNTWERGKGRALSIALIMLSYYKNTNPVLASLARQILKNICG